MAIQDREAKRLSRSATTLVIQIAATSLLVAVNRFALRRLAIDHPMANNPISDKTRLKSRVHIGRCCAYIKLSNKAKSLAISIKHRGVWTA
jgi:hypothetical protein